MKKRSLFTKLTALLTGCLMLASPLSVGAEVAEVDILTESTADPTVTEETNSISTPEVTDTIPAASVSEEPEENKPYTILLIGSDRRSDGWNGNSDAILLVTIRHDKKQLLVTSIMRDTFVPIPGRGTHKINNAYATGGAPLLEQTIEEYFGVTIDNYAAVDWASASAVVDLLGGVDIEINSAEVDAVNSYTGDVCRAIGADESAYYISGSGLQHLAGPQAVAYARIRKVGNNDFERTERQRDIITSLLGGLTIDSATAALSSISEILDLIDNDLTPIEAAALAAQYLVIKDYEIVLDRIPYDGMYTSENEHLNPDQPATNERLQAALYGE